MQEQVLEEIRIAADLFSKIAQGDCSTASCFNDVVAAMHHICSRISAADQEGCDRESIRLASETARIAHARSPFVERLQIWPRGYPGDFETIEYLMSQQVQSMPGTLEFWIEYYALGSMIAQQHRNKVAAQASQIARIFNKGIQKPKILVIAAGSSPDLVLVESLLKEQECEVLLNDGDKAALEFSLERLNSVRHRLNIIHGNAITAAGKLDRFGPFDLVLAGGLFDYLPDRHAEFLVQTVWDSLLAPGGRFFFTNLGKHNPYRVWMEYMADWRLIERSDSELSHLVTSMCGSEAISSTKRDATGLTWLVSVDRAV